MRIIQISGKGRVGKSTFAKMIADEAFELGYMPVIIPFAQAIKVQAEKEGISKEENSSKYREFCQELGATKRAEDPDYWVVKTMELIQEYMIKEIDNKKAEKKYWEYLIIQDDVRYMNELAMGRDLVATQIFLYGNDRVLSESNANWRRHESEILANEVEDDLTNHLNKNYSELFDVVVDNSESLKHLELIVKLSLPDWLEQGYLELEEYSEETN